MLKITVEEKSEAMTLKLEGRLTGPWVAELDHLWEKASPARSGRHLSLDLREVTFADDNGIRVLRSIYSETGAAILSGTPLTQYLAEQIKRTDESESAGV